MKIDKDTKSSDDDNRKEDETIEHVYFSNPHKMIGKRIGFRVLNNFNKTLK